MTCRFRALAPKERRCKGAETDELRGYEGAKIATQRGLVIGDSVANELMERIEKTEHWKYRNRNLR